MYLKFKSMQPARFVRSAGCLTTEFYAFTSYKTQSEMHVFLRLSTQMQNDRGSLLGDFERKKRDLFHSEWQKNLCLNNGSPTIWQCHAPILLYLICFIHGKRTLLNILLKKLMISQNFVVLFHHQ
jgi:hypothetical protein